MISAGLAAALTSQGNRVQCFKKGPDYIDPMWLRAASGRPCYNLDFNTMSVIEMRGLIATKSQSADLGLIEANKGLFDGVDLKGADSNAELARVTRTPVILVVDTTGMTRGIAPLLFGYQNFDPDIRVSGVILNNVGGARHEGKLRAAVEEYSDTKVVGAVWRSAKLDIDERHLGLITPLEIPSTTDLINTLGEIVGQSTDLGTIGKIARSAKPLSLPAATVVDTEFQGLKIAMARDAAFGFYYEDDIETFAALGAELVFFDATKDAELPKVDGLFIGGGFPETQALALSRNRSLRSEIRQAILTGLPAYAECGGLMYLCEQLKWHANSFEMCGVIPANAVMCQRPQGRGHVEFTTIRNHPWGQQPGIIRAHEFHYAKLEGLSQDTKFCENIQRGHGITGEFDGMVLNNLLASFCHLRHTSNYPWIKYFLSFVKRSRSPI